MNYEQKYKNALERAVNLFVTNNISATAACEIFPELNESEEERIRKWLIDWARAVNWSEQFTITKEQVIVWLEKQGEKKPADKVEPRFNFEVGQWIVATGKCVYLITKIDEFTVTLVDVMGNEYEFSTDSLNDAALWTVENAKEGDVLYAKGGYFKEYVFKFSSFTEDNVISTHFGYDVFHGTFDTKLSRFGREEDFVFVNPATKEQRELLFQKMKEAGYEWDSKKKELKKIEVKKLDADKVIEWLNDRACLGWIEDVEVDKFVEKFKKDFGL